VSRLLEQFLGDFSKKYPSGFKDLTQIQLKMKLIINNVNPRKILKYVSKD